MREFILNFTKRFLTGNLAGVLYPTWLDFVSDEAALNYVEAIEGSFLVKQASPSGPGWEIASYSLLKREGVVCEYENTLYVVKGLLWQGPNPEITGAFQALSLVSLEDDPNDLDLRLALRVKALYPSLKILWIETEVS